ncbi:MAG: signal peptidase I [Oscillospiraceae bacterium]
MRPSFHRLWRIVTGLLVALVFLLAFLLSGIRLLGFTPYAVLSGSMEPRYPVGGILYVRKVDPRTVSPGTPITFTLPQSAAVATHRVVSVEPETRCFRTKGDANALPDVAPVPFGAVLGVPLFSLPFLGYLSRFLMEPAGRVVGLLAGGLPLLLLVLPDLLSRLRAKSRNAA